MKLHVNTKNYEISEVFALVLSTKKLVVAITICQLAVYINIFRQNIEPKPRPLQMQMMITYLDKILSLKFLKESLTIYFVLTYFQLVLGFF